MLIAALEALEAEGIEVVVSAPVLRSDPVGPSLRRYANGAAVVESRLDPPDLLAALKRVERAFGRRARGQRWSARVIDLDIVLWSGGPFAARGLTVPHPLFRQRGFVLNPAAAIAGQWRDPVTRLTLRQLRARLTRPRRVRR